MAFISDRGRWIAGALAALLAVVALGHPASAEGAPRKVFRAVTTFTVIQDIAQNVAGDRAIVDSITRPGAEIHDYQPTPLDIVGASRRRCCGTASISNAG
jgi:manganese/iron transport system substrate-binding protein